MKKFEIGDRIECVALGDAPGGYAVKIGDRGTVLSAHQSGIHVNWDAFFNTVTTYGYSPTEAQFMFEKIDNLDNTRPYVSYKPSGGKLVTEGVKHDSGKPDMSLLSGTALLEITKVLDFGAKKYDPHNWRKGMKWTRLSSAALRHLFAWIGGEDKDPESGISHLAHAACCLVFLLEFEVTHKDKDDRFKKETK